MEVKSEFLSSETISQWLFEELQHLVILVGFNQLFLSDLHGFLIEKKKKFRKCHIPRQIKENQVTLSCKCSTRFLLRPPKVHLHYKEVQTQLDFYKRSAGRKPNYCNGVAEVIFRYVQTSSFCVHGREILNNLAPSFGLFWFQISPNLTDKHRVLTAARLLEFQRASVPPHSSTYPFFSGFVPLFRDFFPLLLPSVTL